jgi:hypothetical protein
MAETKKRPGVTPKGSDAPRRAAKEREALGVAKADVPAGRRRRASQVEEADVGVLD